MKKILLPIIIIVTAALNAWSADPMATDFSFDKCQGSLTPYPSDIKSVTYPDSLTPVMINHVGRHGARYPASSKFCTTMLDALRRAQDGNTITALGKNLMKLTTLVMEQSDNRWGALDSLGEYEQRMIASRMYTNFKPVFDSARINAISSYSPRCMMSMYCFTHQLDRLNNHMEFTTSTGRSNSPLLRFFDTDEDYKDFIKSGKPEEVYTEYFNTYCPTSALERVLGKDFEYADADEARNLAITEYYVLAGCAAMMIDCDLSQYFTRQEINALWSCFNLRQYLNRTATTLSTLPADIAAYLLKDLIASTDDFINGSSDISVQLRFGHAETLMPLLSLMHLKGCYYMTNYFDTVAKNWQDFYVVPMAANLQLILFKNVSNGKYYLRADLNEVPVALIPNSNAIYVPWDTAKAYLTKCVPFYAQ